MSRFITFVGVSLFFCIVVLLAVAMAALVDAKIRHDNVRFSVEVKQEKESPTASKQIEVVIPKRDDSVSSKSIEQVKIKPAAVIEVKPKIVGRWELAVDTSLPVIRVWEFREDGGGTDGTTSIGYADRNDVSSVIFTPNMIKWSVDGATLNMDRNGIRTRFSFKIEGDNLILERAKDEVDPFLGRVIVLRRMTPDREKMFDDQNREAEERRQKTRDALKRALEETERKIQEERKQK